MFASDKVLDMVRELAEFDSGNNLLMLMNFLLTQIAQVMEENLPTEEEIEAAVRAEKLILEDVRLHYDIPSIATRVGLNENRLKYVFRKAYKKSIYNTCFALE